YEDVTLRSTRDDRILVKELSVSIPVGTNVVIVGPNDAAQVALFRATAGIWDHASGRIIRPGPDAMLFLPERPYLAPGRLRDVRLPAARELAIETEQLPTLLRALHLDDVLDRVGGLQAERDWDDVLSLTEQKLFSIARVVLAAPKFVFLQRPRAALGPAQADRVMA